MFKFLLLFLSLSISLNAYSSQFEDNFLPPKDEDLIKASTVFNPEMTEAKFNKALAWVKKTYDPIFTEKGLKFQIIPDWKSTVVNAYAQRIGDTAKIMMFGGLARRVNFMGFLVVACHEVGHHLGGAPRYPSRWASNEGQSDYFSTAKCMKLVLNQNLKKRARPLRSKDSELGFAYGKCKKTYRGRKNKRNRVICTRVAKGALSTATLLNSGVVPKFTKPDMSVVTKTNDRHPKGQCRLDTYFQGSLCSISPEKDFDESNPRINACNRVDDRELGARPLCWFRP